MDLGSIEERDVRAGDSRRDNGAWLWTLVARDLGSATGIHRRPYFRRIRVADERTRPQLRLLYLLAHVVPNTHASALRGLFSSRPDASDFAHCGCSAAAFARDRHRAAATHR